MKKLVFSFLVTALLTSFSACGGGSSSNNGGGTGDENVLTVHYQRTSGVYTNYTLWLWLDTTAASKTWPKGLDYSSIDSFGAVFKVPLNPGASKIGLLPVDKTVGDASKDGGDHLFNFIEQYKEVYVFQGDNNVYISSAKGLPAGIIGAEITSATTIQVNWASTTDTAKVSTTASDYTVKDKAGTTVTVASVAKDSTYVVTLTVPAIPTSDATKVPYTVTQNGIAAIADVGTKLIDNVYGYDGNDLGATYNSTTKAVTLKLWAPKASAVAVQFYGKGADSDNAAGPELAMVAGTTNPGVWSLTVAPATIDAAATDTLGYAYQYLVTNGTTEKVCLDPYAKSMAECNIDTTGAAVTGKDPDLVGKAAVIDLSTTGTVSAVTIAGYNGRNDAVLYETHVRDYTSFWGVKSSYSTDLSAQGLVKPSSALGSYNAMAENAAYIGNLGYTHVQLLPVMKFYYGDEGNKDLETTLKGGNCNYNWGYDPHSYFTPAGMYASDTTDPHARVKELKDLCQSLHDQGVGVILDVVYNHMAKSSILEDIVPGYYFFMKNGSLVNPGYGNTLGSNHKMTRKLIIDSVKYFMNEYGVDGFRFDLMGGTDVETMEAVYAAAKAINPKVIILGEGWSGFYGGTEGVSCDQGAMNQVLSDGAELSTFSDEIRNLLKSGYGAEESPRFCTGGGVSLSSLLLNIKAQPSNFNSATTSIATKNSANAPGMVIQYATAHDNMALGDIISRHIGKSRAVAIEEINQRLRLVNFMLLSSQGVPFMLAGSEFGASKECTGAAGLVTGKYTDVVYTGEAITLKYMNDSYDSSDAINMLDWSMVETSKPGYVSKEHTKGMIALRRSEPLFRLADKANVESYITKVSFTGETTSDKVIGYKLSDGTTTYYVLVNADSVARSVTLDQSVASATVLVDGDEAGTAAVAAHADVVISDKTVTLDPLTPTVIKL